MKTTPRLTTSVTNILIESEDPTILAVPSPLGGIKLHLVPSNTHYRSREGCPPAGGSGGFVLAVSHELYFV
jgi:hypothetical protein